MIDPHNYCDMDWIDQEKARRDKGITRPLTQPQHQAVNRRYPGCTRQTCVDCDGYTGRTTEDELHIEAPFGDLYGPLCEDCWDDYYDQKGYKDPLK